MTNKVYEHYLGLIGRRYRRKNQARGYRQTLKLMAWKSMANK